MVGALDIAVTEPAAGGIGAAAAAGEAQLGKAVHDGGVTGQVAGLLLLEGDASHVGQGVAGVIGQGIAVDEDEGGLGILDGGLLQRGLLQVTGAHHHVSAALDGGLHGVIAVIVGGLAAVGGLVVLVAQTVGGGIQLYAVKGALVEGLVLQLAYVGDEGHLILAVGGGHAVLDGVGVGLGLAGGLGLGRGGLGVSARRRGLSVGGLVAVAAGGQAEDHRQAQEQCKELLGLLHCNLPSFQKNSPVWSRRFCPPLPERVPLLYSIPSKRATTFLHDSKNFLQNCYRCDRLKPSSITVFFSIRVTLHTSAAFTGIGLRAGRSLL